MNHTKTMDPDLKAKWLEALRSRRYAQTKEYLRQDGGFCCLGVLCDVVNPQAWTDDEAWKYTGDDGEESDITELPESFRERVGITYRTMHDLISLNDGQGASFAQIADYIEKTL